MKKLLIVTILVILVACAPAVEEPDVAESDTLPAAKTEPVATEQPTVLPDPTSTPGPTSISEPMETEDPATPLPAETTVPTRTPHPAGIVKGCLIWTDGSLIDGFISFYNELGKIDGWDTGTVDGCFRKTVPSGQYELSATVGHSTECGYERQCGADRTLIDVPSDGVVTIDFYPAPFSTD